MGGIGLCTCLHIIALQVINVDALVVEHAIESVNRKLLIDAVDGSLNIFSTLIEIISVNGTEGCLVEICTADQEESGK